MLWRDALIMYDRATRSLWSQVNGRAVAGPEKGKHLEELPSELTTWGDWIRRHPDTLVLLKPPLAGSAYDDYFADPEKIGVRGSTNPDSRLPGKELVLGLEHHGAYAAVPLSDLATRPVINSKAFGIPIVLFGNGQTAAAYDRRVGGETLTFDSLRRDRQTESSWNWETGEAVSGPMKGTKLQRISSKPVYWAIWARFHPGSAIVRQ